MGNCYLCLTWLEPVDHPSQVWGVGIIDASHTEKGGGEKKLQCKMKYHTTENGVLY